MVLDMAADRGTLAVFGDSIANGLGVAEGRYAVTLANRWGLELEDWSVTAGMVTGALDRLPANSAPQVTIIAHGITEAIVRPSEASLRLLPKRWRRPGWMDPRPYFSTRWRRRVLERIESGVRWRVKNVAIRMGATTQFVPVASFDRALRATIAELHRRGARVIVLGAPDLDERFFPGSPRELQEYGVVAQSAASDLGATWVPLAGELSRWSDFFADHFHPNQEGHNRIASTIERYFQLGPGNG
ncbi:SGNH/GDSL hydrolase family protein [Demequina sediminis]|nr:hypothetical protein GCM10025873_25090 [Demequina sediminis]